MAPSTRILIPIAIAAICCFGMAHYSDNIVYGWVAVGLIILGAFIYILAPQIDWRIHKRNPPQMPATLHRFFENKIDFYQKMHPFIRKKFRERVMLFAEATDYKAQVTDEFPDDLKILIAASAVRLTMHQEDFLFRKFEHVILYPHPFPSPQILDHWHASEIHEEDGVVMFAAEQLMKGFTQPTRYFNISLYEYARVFRLTYPEKKYPDFDENVWQEFHQISRFSKDAIHKWMGLPELDATAVGIAHYFTFPKRFQQVLPKQFQQLKAIFQKES